MIEVKNISFNINKKQILEDVSTSFSKGKLTAILGPNGSGKSTLVKIISNIYKKYKGDILIDNQSLESYSEKELAKKRAVLLQQMDVSLPFTVNEIVMMGRYPFIKHKPSEEDHNRCRVAMQKAGITHLKNERYSGLSGGEKQRVQFARVLTQILGDSNESRILILDEPINNLDIKHQINVLDIAKEFSQNGNTVIAVLHDLNLAVQYADDILFLKNGKKVCEGQPEEILTKELLSDIYEINVDVFNHPKTNQLIIQSGLATEHIKTIQDIYGNY